MLSRAETRFQDWIISFLLLIWFGYVALEFVASRSAPPSSHEAILMSITPHWASSGQALGVWTGFAGAVLLILGSRMALLGFVASLVGSSAYVYYAACLRRTPDMGFDELALLLGALIICLFAMMYSNALAVRRVLR